MSQGWMRIREAAHLMELSQSTVRRRMESGDLRGRVGPSGRQEVFLPAKLRRELEAKAAEPCTPGHLMRGKGDDQPEAVQAQTQEAVGETSPNAEHTDTPAADGAAHEALEEGDVLKRYERLAGGSLILAQQHSDELKKHADNAYEQLAHTRSQIRQLRKFALAGWVSSAAALVFGLVLAVNASAGKHKAEAQAAANRVEAREADERADELNALLQVTRRSAAQTPADGTIGTARGLIHSGRRGPDRTANVPSE